jgi:phosphatidylinositol glycan class S
VVLESPSTPLEILQNVAAKTEATLRLDEDHSVYSFEVSATDAYRNVTGEPAITVVLNEDGKAGDPVANLLSMTSTLKVTHGPPGSTSSDAISTFLAQEVRRIFQDEQASIAYLLGGSSFSKASQGFQLSHETTQAIEKRTTRAFKYASTYHVTFSLFAASASPSAWDIEEAIQQYIHPLLRQLATVSDCSLLSLPLLPPLSWMKQATPTSSYTPISAASSTRQNGP